MESDNALEVVMNAPEIDLTAINNLIIGGEGDERLGKQKKAVGLGLLKSSGLVGDSAEFVKYCADNYGYERAYTYRMASAGMVFIALSTIVDKAKWPKSVSQATILARLNPAEQCKLWAKLDEAGELQSLTAEKLNCFVLDLLVGKLNDASLGGNTVDIEENEASADKMTVEDETEPCNSEQEIGEEELLPPGVIDADIIDLDNPPVSSRNGQNNAVASPQSSYPPWGMDAVQRKRIMATGLNFVRMGIHESGKVYIEQWSENPAGWQELLPLSKSIGMFWKKLIDDEKVIECY